MIHIDIKNHLVTIPDDNQKLQFLQELNNQIQLMANLIQSRHQTPFAEVIDIVVEPIVQSEQGESNEEITTNADIDQ